MARNRPVGTGKSKLKQSIVEIVRANNQDSGLTLATVVAPGVIRLDVDGFDIYAEEGDFIVDARSTFKTGDRVVVEPLLGSRGKVYVHGKWAPTVQIPNTVARIRLKLFDQTGLTIVNDPSGTATVRVLEQFSRGWVYPASSARVFGECVRNGGSSGVCTVTVYDDALGARTQIGQQVLAPDGQFNIALPWSTISNNDMNFIEVELSFDDAVVNTATIRKCILLAEEP
jgi:hypothetical protein